MVESTPASRPFRLPTPVVGAAIGLVAVGLGLLASRVGFIQAFEAVTYDWRVRWTAEPASSESPIVVVEINESSIRSLEPIVGRWPWPRLVHASAVDYLARSGARVIAYDVLFGEREGARESVVNGQRISGDDSDRAFVDAVARAGNVVLLADATFQGLSSGAPLASAGESLTLPGPAFRPGAGFQMRPQIDLPFSALAEVAAGIGHNYLAKDSGSDAARRVLPFVEHDGMFVPALGVAAALAYLDVGPGDVALESDVLRIGDARLPLLADPVPAADGPLPSRQALLRLPRPTVDADGVRSTFPTYSFYDVVLSEDNVLSGRAPVVPAEAFAGRTVFVGTTAAGTYDRYASPFPGGMAGVEIHATVADNVIGRRTMRRASAAADAGHALAAGLGAGLAAAILPVGLAVVLTVVTMAGLAVWLTVAVGSGWWIGAVLPMMSAAFALFGGVAWRYAVEDRERRRIRQLFGRYVSSDVIEQLVTDPSLVRLGGQRRNMTVLFSDIRGFTSASERATPEAVVAQLNEYFGAMVEVLFRHRGTLDKFVGDMVMGLFGAPVADNQHADHAVEAALDMVATLDRLNAKWRGEGRPELNIGIGVNTGEMIAGNIGSDAIMSYTVIGDAVNLGSRLESLNKEYGTRILISQHTLEALTLPVVTRPIGEVTVKGRTRPVGVFEVAGLEATPAGQDRKESR